MLRGAPTIALFFWLADVGAGELHIRLENNGLIPEGALKNCFQNSDPRFSGITVHSYVFMNVLDIDQIREDFMEFSLHSYVSDAWQNPVLNISVPSPQMPYELPSDLASCMWKPDMIFPNSKSSTLFQHTVENIGYKVMPDKFFYRVARYMFRVSCPMSFQLYPMDTQVCVFKIAMIISPDDLVTLHWSSDPGSPSYLNRTGINLFYRVKNLQFRLDKVATYKVVEKWVVGNFTELWGNFTFSRRLMGSVVNLYVPSCLVVILSWLSFWIDVGAVPARITLGVTALLTISTQVVQSRSLLPPVHYITALDVWLFACLGQVFSSMIEYSVAYNWDAWARKVAAADASKSPEERYTKSPLSSEEAWSNDDFKRQENAVPVLVQGQQQFKVISRRLRTNPVPGQNALDRVSRWLYPTVMVAFATVYWSYLVWHFGHVTQ